MRFPPGKKGDFWPPESSDGVTALLQVNTDQSLWADDKRASSKSVFSNRQRNSSTFSRRGLCVFVNFPSEVSFEGSDDHKIWFCRSF